MTANLYDKQATSDIDQVATLEVKSSHSRLSGGVKQLLYSAFYLWDCYTGHGHTLSGVYIICLVFTQHI